MVSLPNHLGGWFGGVGRFDRLSDQWAQGPGGELAEPSGLSGIRQGRALRQAQRPDGELVEPFGLSSALGLRLGWALRQAQRPMGEDLRLE